MGITMGMIFTRNESRKGREWRGSYGTHALQELHIAAMLLPLLALALSWSSMPRFIQVVIILGLPTVTVTVVLLGSQRGA